MVSQHGLPRDSLLWPLRHQRPMQMALCKLRRRRMRAKQQPCPCPRKSVKNPVQLQASRPAQVHALHSSQRLPHALCQLAKRSLTQEAVAAQQARVVRRSPRLMQPTLPVRSHTSQTSHLQRQLLLVNTQPGCRARRRKSCRRSLQLQA